MLNSVKHASIKIASTSDNIAGVNIPNLVLKDNKNGKLCFFKRILNLLIFPNLLDSDLSVIGIAKGGFAV